ncbi:MAG: response regulator receiver modulated diguanylate cyclase [Betaproteobacteria bacterium]|nr:response regulator receiver modulated diguanylate cyclase [Betaproteobacteria bacterium]
MKLLIADDDDVNLTLLELLLQDLGHDVVVARDGAEAWEVMESENAPALAILDWVMPGLDGTEICRRLRQQAKRPYQYLIMLSAKEEMEDLVEGIGSGADDYLRKPFDARELGARLAAGERVLALQDELRARAMFDQLTGLFNRATILERLQREIEHSMRKGDPASIILIDLDNFKYINDTHGHPVGDEVLRQASKTLTACVRTYDEVGRYGGEEFLAVLPGCDASSALHVAERMRESLSTLPSSTCAGLIHVSASFGVATMDGSHCVGTDVLVAEADAALYRAKRAGRNRVEGSIARPGEPELTG